MSSPKRKSLPAGYEINPATNRRRKVCPPGKVRSPGKPYCVKQRSGSPRRKSKSKRKSLPAGYEINPRTGRRRKVCPPGKQRAHYAPYYCIKSPRRNSSSPRRKSKSPRRKSKSPRRKSKSPKTDDCCVCLERTNRAVSSCNHPLCNDCLTGMRRSGRTVKCPLCRGPCSGLSQLR